jgi:hypothetical protein
MASHKKKKTAPRSQHEGASPKQPKKIIPDTATKQLHPVQKAYPTSETRPAVEALPVAQTHSVEEMNPGVTKPVVETELAQSWRRAPMNNNDEMATEEQKRLAEEMKRTGEETAENMRRNGEEFKRAATDFDLKGMSKAWKQGYIGGLEAACLSQEQTERLLKEAIKQGVAASQQTLSVYEQWLEQIQKHAGPAAPFVEWSRQLVRNFHDNSDQLVKTATEAVESGFSYYANTVSRPTRKYTLDVNKKVMDTVISA